MAQYRRERINDLLLSFLAEKVRIMRDPRLSLVTLTAVEVSRDLQTAKVFWTVPAEVLNEGEKPQPIFPTEERRGEVQRALVGAEGLLKKKIGEELELRHVPQLRFQYDKSAMVGSRIDHLLKEAGY